MKALLLLLIISSTAYAQTFNIEYEKVSPNETRFSTIYTGPAGEITLPARSRITALPEQANINVGGGKIRITGSGNHTVRFTYAVISPSQGILGSILQNWFPTVPKGAEYNLMSGANGGFVYPYESYNNKIFKFTSDQNPNLAAMAFNEFQESNVTVFTAYQDDFPIQDVINTDSYMRENFGSQDYSNIVVINTPISDTESIIDDGTLYLNINGRGTQRQLLTAFSSVWKAGSPVPANIYDMFLDTMFRLSPIQHAAEVIVESNAQNSSQNEQQTAQHDSQQSQSTNELDLGYVVMIPPNEYYKNLFQKGFEPQKLPRGRHFFPSQTLLRQNNHVEGTSKARQLLCCWLHKRAQKSISTSFV